MRLRPIFRSLRIVKYLRWTAFALCIGLFVWGLAHTDVRAGVARMIAIGPIVLVVLAPFPIALALDTAAWRVLMGSLGHRVPWLPLYKVRLGTEAVNNSTPGGMVWGEALAPVLVARRTGVPVSDVIAASMAKRWIVVRMHATYVALAAALGYPALSRASRALVGGDAMVVVVVVGAFGLVLLAMGIEALTARGHVAGRVSGFIGRRRFRGVQKWIEGRRHHFTHADEQIAKLSRDDRSARKASAWLFGMWVVEGIETFLILHLLGADIGLVEVMSFDAALSVVRSAAVFAPAGIGIQDVGYLAVLEAYGVPAASGIAPAFVLIKRLKEAVFVAIGFVMIARTSANRRFQRVAQSVSAGT